MYKNFQIRTHQAEWAKKRAIARIETDRAIAALTDERNRQIKKINDEAAEQVKRINNEINDCITKERLKLYERLREIAIEQDEFEDEFRNYAATLPKDEEE